MGLKDFSVLFWMWLNKLNFVFNQDIILDFASQGVIVRAGSNAIVPTDIEITISTTMYGTVALKICSINYEFVTKFICYKG